MLTATSRRWAAPVVAGALLLLGGCTSADDVVDEPPLPPSTVPVAEGTWTAMPLSPLSPRGAATALWTGEQLLLLGGFRTDGQNAPCPAAASCTGPPTTAFGDGAAWDPATGEWTHLTSGIPDDPGGISRLSRDPAVWAGTQAFTRGSTITPDLPAGSVSVTPIDAGPGLVYADPVWTGDRLVLVPGAYSPPGSGEANLVQADAYDPATGEVSVVPWPFGPPGATETSSTVWTGREVVAFVTVAPPDGPRGCRTVAFDPVTDTWRLISDEIPFPTTAVWDGHHVQAVVGDELLTLDVDTAATTTTDLPDSTLDEEGHRVVPSTGPLLAGPGGQLLLLGQWRYVLARAGTDGPVDEGAWRRLPDVPTDVVTRSSAVLWAGDDVVVWGGMAPGVVGEPGVNTADGWVFDLAER